MSGEGLPVLAFLRRNRPRAGGGEKALLQAELRCVVCGERAACRLRLAAGESLPPEGCPNAALFAQSALRNASRGDGRNPAA